MFHVAHAIITVLSYPSKLYGKALLLKILHTLTSRYREINLNLIRKYFPRAGLLRVSKYFTGGRRENL